jgi:hypothetical protein
MDFESRIVSEWIDRPVQEVYDFVADPAHLPAWAGGLGGGIENDGGDWFVSSPEGRIGVAFVPRNEYGVLDHYVTFPSGETYYNPMRATVGGKGCEVAFSVRRLEGMTDAEFDRDAGLVAADLTRLKAILEA